MSIIKDLLKSSSKIGAFCILGLCSTYAFKTLEIEALKLGVIAFVVLVGNKTAWQSLPSIMNKK